MTLQYSFERYNKVNISFMNLIAWSPAVCKELRRLCTHVAKKRALKAKRMEQAPFSGDSTGSAIACYAYATYATILYYDYR